MNKSELHQTCLAVVENQRKTILQQIASLQADAASDGKSTAGDKHETSRAMAHLEQEQLGKQLLECNQRLEALHGMKNQLGRLVVTNIGTFYIAVSLGKVETEEGAVTVISGQSPMAQILNKLQEGSEFQMGPNKGIVLQMD